MGMEIVPNPPCSRCYEFFAAASTGTDAPDEERNTKDGSNPVWESVLHDFGQSVGVCPSCRHIWDIAQGLHTRAQGRFPDVASDTNLPLSLKLQRREELHAHPEIDWAWLQVTVDVKRHGYSFARAVTVGVCRQLEAVPYTWVRGPTPKSRRLLQMETWFQDCKSNHIECVESTTYTPAFLVQTIRGKPIRLVGQMEILSSDSPLQYATLSHCWGSSLQLRTTRANVADYEQNIPQDLIPPTFRDAIHICHHLNIPHLWIDSLCIVQDDDEAWSAEAYMMRGIYSGSVLTIAATDSPDSFGGCFPIEVDIQREGFSKDAEAGATAHTQTAQPGPGDAVTSEQPPEVTVISVSPPTDMGPSASCIVRISPYSPRWPPASRVLSGRGWTFQEQVLPQRVLHCMKDEIHWQCRCSYLTESGMDGGPNNYLVEMHDKTWENWVIEFSSRLFTFPTDRTAAIAGITDRYQEFSGYTPVLGMWRETFVRDLAWLRTSKKLTADVKMPASTPSWTWLSCYASTTIDLTWSGNRTSPPWETEEHAEVIELDVSWEGPPLTSAIKSTRLVLKGRVIETKLCVAPEGKAANPCYMLVDDEVTDYTKGPLPWSCGGQFDNPKFSDRDRTSYSCLLVKTMRAPITDEETQQENTYTHQVFLILEPTIVGDVHGFRRVGTAWFIDKGLTEKPTLDRFKDARMEEVRLF